MKIFYATSVLGDAGGSEIYTRDLLTELLGRGHELCVFTPINYDLEGAEMVHTPVWGHHAFHKFEAALFCGGALKAAEKFGPDIVQSHSNSLMGYVGHRVKRRLGVPHVLLIELISSQNRSLHTKAIFRMEKFMLPKLNYDRLVVWTENMKQKFLLPWGIEEGKIEVMPAALNLANYPACGGGDEVKKEFGEHLITSIKTLWGTNALGLKYVIKAMEKVSKEHAEYKYVIFGEGTHRKMLEDYTEKLGLRENVKFAGAIQPQKCREVWQATEIAPHSFVYEFSTSISLLEYMATGKACVVTDIGSVKELVGESALLVKPENADSIAEGIIRLIEDRALRERLGRKAREIVEEKYTIKKSADRLERIYAELLSN
ncbi:MAG: glycosyltransferase family 4 protein [Candidatus Diapherotrites archaeon]